MRASRCSHNTLQTMLKPTLAAFQVIHVMSRCVCLDTPIQLPSFSPSPFTPLRYTESPIAGGTSTSTSPSRSLPFPLPPLRGRFKCSQGSDERCRLSQRFLRHSHIKNRIWCVFTLKSGIWWHHFHKILFRESIKHSVCRSGCIGDRP